MQKFQKNQTKQTLNFRTPDWFKGKILKKVPEKIRPIIFRGTQHRG